jgi:predicted transcriptional regulator
MSNGYSASLQARINQADSSLIGVQLGKFCMANDISVTRIAEALGVSRQSVYYWFVGSHEPSGPHVLKIQRLLAAAKKHSAA